MEMRLLLKSIEHTEVTLQLSKIGCFELAGF